ncbi:MAG TPA: CrcB family protein [Saliniramus sp.]|nr:CrcB family protein [Saliniramus sp.]
MSGLAPRILLAVGAGSALGAVARHVTSLFMLDAFGPGVPWGTLCVNVLGSFLIGLLAAVLAGEGGPWRNHATRQFLLAGFCGGFTTFSIFSLELLIFMMAGDWTRAGAYLALSVVLWLAAVWAGFVVGERLRGNSADRA